MISEDFGSSCMWQPAGRKGKPLLHSSLGVAAGAAEQRPEAPVVAKLLAVLPTKSRTVQNAFPSSSQSAPELLQEQRGALGRAQQQHGVDVGTSTPSLNRSTENTTWTRAGAQVVQRGSAFGFGLSPQTATDTMPCVVEQPAMNRACAMLTQNPRRAWWRVVALVDDLLDHGARPGFGARVQVGQGVDVVARVLAARDVA